MRHTTARVGADVGGTFTDIVLIDAERGVTLQKLPSTPDDFGRAIVDGVAHLLPTLAVAPRAVADVVHGTTVATNTILEFKGALTGLLTTRGFRDVLELRRLRVPKLYDLFWDKPRPLVERALRLEIDERIDHTGAVLVPLDLAQAERAAEQLVTAGVEAIAVSLLHAYANPAHEQAIGDLLRRRWPHLSVSLSHEILPIIREYERTSTTVINAYVQPLVAHYVQSLRGQLDAADVTAPLLIMQSNGGVMSDVAAAIKPAYIVESGPAAGVIASVGLARALGIDNVITFDMGGTTAKASVVEHGTPDFTSEFEVAAGISLSSKLSSGGGYALSVPFIDLSEVGAGGGSIVWLDPGGAPKVGPHSAGARPGPVCYAQGGTLPTVTDANVILGYINPTSLLDGAMPIDADAARRVLDEQVATPLGLSLHDAAFGVHQLANASMIRAVKAVSSQRGRDPRKFTLFAFGGSGPVHAAGIARELEIGRIVVPRAPGFFSAFGLLAADLEHHAVRTFLRRTATVDLNELGAAFDALEQRCRADLGRSDLQAEQVQVERWVEMRYVGQAYELPVAAPLGNFKSSDLEQFEDDFHAMHERTYGHRTDNVMEIVNLRVVCRIPNDSSTALTYAPGTNGVAHRPTLRSAYFGPDHGVLETPVLRRDALTEQPIGGPLVVEEYDATVVVPPGCTAARDALGNIIIEVDQ
ncbi:MAG TPA: hydantoinase/oxoprolinase family protein [Chloroflexota bacterium]